MIGDCHFPWVSAKGLKAVYEIAKKLEPTHIIQIGDLYDFFSFSKFPRHQIITPKDELEQGYTGAHQMWLTLKAIAPKAKKYQLVGNHDERLLKRVTEALPEIESLIPWDNLFNFKNVEFMGAERNELRIEDLCFMHGFRTKLGDHAKHNSLSTITGHSHVGGCLYFRLGERILFELNAGYLGCERAPVFSYTKQRLFARWTLGCGVIDEYGPRFIPFGG